ncbi:hypothetical protein ACFL5O_00530 [Myxococcota bacterium]
MHDAACPQFHGHCRQLPGYGTCGSRARPFLGDQATLRENVDLQRTVAPEAAWLGMMAWGEIYLVAGRPTFHNYAYPLLVLSE